MGEARAASVSCLTRRPQIAGVCGSSLPGIEFTRLLSALPVCFGLGISSLSSALNRLSCRELPGPKGSGDGVKGT